jgi:putative SOS response-associated peptidase YedK
MCNIYSGTTNKEAIRELVRAIGEWTDHMGNFEPLTGVFPDQMAPIVRSTPDGGRELIRMRWGSPSPPSAKSKITTNIRNVAYNWWRPWLQAGHRCLVPATSFCEPDNRTGKCVWTWFAQDEARSPFFFAGVWRVAFGERKGETGQHLVFSF